MSIKRKLSAAEAQAESTNHKKPRSTIRPLEGAPFPRGIPTSGQSQIGHRNGVDADEEELFSAAAVVKQSKDARVWRDKPVTGQTIQRKRAHGKNPGEKDKSDRSSIPIMRFNSRSLETGTTVLGLVVDVRPQELVLSLPNGLFGHVSSSAVSPIVAERLSSISNEVASHDGGESDASSSAIDLRELFKVSQYLRTAYLLEPDDATRINPLPVTHRYQLTILPSKVNGGITRGELAVGAAIQASVLSVEDHGYIMDCGGSMAGCRGFIQKSTRLTHESSYTWEPGSVVLCIVSKLGPSSSTIGLSVDEQWMKAPTRKQTLASLVSIKNLGPGTPVDMLVTKVYENGIAGRISDSFDASIDFIHAGVFSQEPIAAISAQIGQRVIGRILVAPRSEDETRLLVTLAARQLDLSPQLPSPQHMRRVEPSLGYGSFVEAAQVIAVDSLGIGLYLDVGQSPDFAFMHISNVSDEHITESGLTTKYGVGTTHRIRVLRYNALDGLYETTMKPSIIGQKYLRSQDVIIGERLNATITNTKIDSRGRHWVNLNLGEGISASVPEIHISDVALREPSKKFSEGKSVMARALSRDPATNSLHCTLRRSFVDSTSPILAGSQDVVPSRFYQGVVTSVKPQGAVIRFYQNFCGFLPTNRLKSDGVDDATKVLDVGRSIEVRVTSSGDSGRMPQLSARREPHPSNGEPSHTKLGIEDLVDPVDDSIKHRGDLVMNKIIKVQIKAVTERQLNVTIAENVIGRINSSMVFHHLDGIKNRKRPLERFKRAQIISAKIVGHFKLHDHTFLPFSHNQPRGIGYEMSLKSLEPSIESKMLSFEEVRGGLQSNQDGFLGFVNNHTSDGVYVTLSPILTTFIWKQLISADSQKIKHPEAFLPAGSALMVYVRDTIVEGGACRMEASGVRDGPNPSLTYENIETGQDYLGVIFGHHPDGLLVKLNDSVSGLVGLMDLADDYDQVETMQSTWPLFHPVQVIVKEVQSPSPSTAAGEKFAPPIRQGNAGHYRRLALSVRAVSRANSGRSTKDPQIAGAEDLVIGQKLRGFVREVKWPIGLFVQIGSNLTALVPLSDVSDKYIKDLDDFKERQLIEVKVSRIEHQHDGNSGTSRGKNTRVQLTHRKSALDDPHYQPLKTFSDLQVGQVVDGVVKSIQTFGLFVHLDKFDNRLDGLCHRSELSSEATIPADLNDLYRVGERIRATIVKVNQKDRQFNLSLKLTQQPDDEQYEPNRSIEGLVLGDAEAEGFSSVEDLSEHAVLRESNMAGAHAAPLDIQSGAGLATNGFDFTGNIFAEDQLTRMSSEVARPRTVSGKSTQSSTMDLDMDSSGPKNEEDYERWLMADSSNSALWKGYIQLILTKQGAADRAREMARRALRTISSDQQAARMEIWVELMQIEILHGSAASLDGVLLTACKSMLPLAVHRNLIGLYQKRGDQVSAQRRFKDLMKLKDARKDITLWQDYARSAFESDELELARSLHEEARRSLPDRELPMWGMYFASLEFKMAKGDVEKGRQIMEYIIGQYPKRVDLWNVYVDREIQLISHDKSPNSLGKQKQTIGAHGDDAELEKARSLFRRITGDSSVMKGITELQEETKGKGNEKRRNVVTERKKPRLSRKKAQFWFEKWAAFERQHGQQKAAIKVQKLQQEWTQRYDEAHEQSVTELVR